MAESSSHHGTTGTYYRVPLAVVSCVYSGSESFSLSININKAPLIIRWFEPKISIRPRIAEHEPFDQALEKVLRPPNGDTQ